MKMRIAERMKSALYIAAASTEEQKNIIPSQACAEKLGYTQKLFNRRPSMRDSFFGNDDFFGDFFSPMPFLLGRMNRMLESPFDDFFDAMPAIGAAPVQEVKEEKKDDLMSHEEQSRFSYLRQLNALKLEQKKAIHEENFERAAQLRDEIHKLEWICQARPRSPTRTARKALNRRVQTKRTPQNKRGIEL